jgi:hypothetical protein
VRYISYDYYVGKFGGRYCEPGVDEATYESNTRPGLMFYELNTFDPTGTSPWKRDSAGELSGTFYGDMLILAQITLITDPQAELQHDNGDTGLASTKEVKVASMRAGNTTALTKRADISDYLVPAGYARVFHPQINLHEMIASLVAYEIIEDHDIRLGNIVSQEEGPTACDP